MTTCIVPPHILPEGAEEGYSRGKHFVCWGRHPPRWVGTLATGRLGWSWILMEDIALLHEGRQWLSPMLVQEEAFLVSLPSRSLAAWPYCSTQGQQLYCVLGIHCTNLFGGFQPSHMTSVANPLESVKQYVGRLIDRFTCRLVDLV